MTERSEIPIEERAAEPADPGAEDRRPGVALAGRLGANGVTAVDEELQPGVIETRNMDVYYGDFKAVSDVTLNFQFNEITALIGPSGCGKSTVLRSLNRMNDLVRGFRLEGSVRFMGREWLPPWRACHRFPVPSLSSLGHPPGGEGSS